jgi:hypothetical protein
LKDELVLFDFDRLFVGDTAFVHFFGFPLSDERVPVIGENRKRLKESEGDKAFGNKSFHGGSTGSL